MATPRPGIADKRQAFRRLHETGCFVIPNPWDVGSARLLPGLGFPALATTSSGFAWSQGHPDNGITVAALGVRRISVGGALARAGWGAFLRAAKLLAGEGRFDGFAGAATGSELDTFFTNDLPRRSPR